MAKGKNTALTYLYRDASNYKNCREEIVAGVLSEMQKQTILSCLKDGEWFLPDRVGLDGALPWEYDPQDDHPYFELGPESFEETDLNPTLPITAAELVEAFVREQALDPDWMA